MSKLESKIFSAGFISLHPVEAYNECNLFVDIYEVKIPIKDGMHPCLVKVRHKPNNSYIELFSEHFILDDEQYKKVINTLKRLVYLSSEFPGFSATIIQNEEKKLDISLQSNVTDGYRLEVQNQGNFFYIPIKSKITIECDNDIVSK
jgi:hypothetical protein